MEKFKKEIIKTKLKKIRESFGMDKVFLILLAGVLLMLSSFPFARDGETAQSGQQDPAGSVQDSSGNGGQAGSAAVSNGYAAEMERRLEEVLLAVEGVGEVKVMITLKDNGEKQLQSDTLREQSSTSETDSSGGSRSVQEAREEYNTVIMNDGSSDSPYIARETVPEIEGVLVVARGAGDTSVKTEIYEAVQALFNVPAHKIKVLKGVLEN